MTDLTALWAFWKKYRHLAGLASLVLLTFIAGWQLGRATSPYYAAHPIVFEEGSGSAGGSVEELAALQAAGRKQRSPAPTVEILAASSPSPVVAGIGDTAQLFAGSKNSTLYHHKDCSAWKRIKDDNIIWWPSQQAAEADGYQPSLCTKEKLGI